MNGSKSAEDFIAQHLRAQAEEADHQLATNSDLINSFIARAATKGIALAASHFCYLPKIGIVAAAPGLTGRLLNGIDQDRDRLYSFETLASLLSLKEYQAGYLRGSNFMVMAHPHFRRGYHDANNFSPRLIELLWGHVDVGTTKHVALDENRVRVNVDESSYFERDTWFGSPFDKQIASIPLGLAKLRPPLSVKPVHLSFFFADAYALDIKWTQEADIKTFQALEMKTDAVTVRLGDQLFYPARYIHAEYDLRLGAFRHFDGAIQYYTESEYAARRDTDFNHNAKTFALVKARSRKLFKFNGRTSVDRWVEFCCHYLSGNPLIHEYFTGRYPTHIIEVLPKLQALDSQSADG